MRTSGRVSDADQEMTDVPEGSAAERSNRIAPDGQRVVDQTGEVAEEREVITRKAGLQEAVARDERHREPSTRFWESPYRQAGPILALLAGVFTLAVRTWPIAVPQGRGTVGTAWFLGATIAGALYILGFFLSDRHWQRARLILVCGAVLHLLVGFLAATIVDEQQVAPGALSFLYDVGPAVVALVAAFLISAPDRRRAHE
jgi:hypothetical protein